MEVDNASGYCSMLPRTIWLKEVIEGEFREINGDLAASGLPTGLIFLYENKTPVVYNWQWLQNWGVEWVALERKGCTHFIRVQSVIDAAA